ncbi:hypothetical protein SAMN04488491_0643 [Psychrobacter sp. LV10R520-6]|nr:hypothetical protein SAMN04488491_0643 [Psychrobacter sp. LV10R520-6]
MADIWLKNTKVVDLFDNTDSMFKMVPLYQSILSGLLIGLKGEITGSVGVYLKVTDEFWD